MMNYRTPNVYIKEESNLPPSVSQVSTAIPAFIGYTEKGFTDNTQTIVINTLLEYETLFGKADSSHFVVNIEQMQIKKVGVTQSNYLLYHAIRHYFENGGGRCYVVSIGNYNKADKRITKDALLKGIEALSTNDEATLIVCPEAIKLNAGDYSSYIAQVLEHCKRVENRFAILDVQQTIDAKSGEYTFNEGDINSFRDIASSDGLKYAAAYYPYLQTTLNHSYRVNDVDIKGNIDLSSGNWETEIKLAEDAQQTLKVSYQGMLNTGTPKVKIVSDTTITEPVKFSVDQDLLLTITLRDTSVKGEALVAAWEKLQATDRPAFGLTFLGDITTPFQAILSPEPIILADKAISAYETGIDLEGAPESVEVSYQGVSNGKIPRIEIVEDTSKTKEPFTFSIDQNLLLSIAFKKDKGKVPTAKTLMTAWEKLSAAERAGFDLHLVADDAAEYAVKVTKKELSKSHLTLAYLQSTSLVLYHQIKATLDEHRIILPPSAAIAGVYARIDRDKGVWKAPANVPVVSVTGPTIRLTDAQQEGLNVDPNTGKSINAIRSFTGKGTLVWGARTLDGSSNEWRYIPVRRLFNTIEASVKKASSFAVFEPNVAITWLKVRTMIESYLNNLWRQGALAGGTPEQAFFVEVGLGKTMTTDDVNNGLLKVSVGVAAVRPAEFIILTFSHKLQEA
jgi:phage tail sheath protein FI